MFETELYLYTRRIMICQTTNNIIMTNRLATKQAKQPNKRPLYPLDEFVLNPAYSLSSVGLNVIDRLTQTRWESLNIKFQITTRKGVGLQNVLSYIYINPTDEGFVGSRKFNMSKIKKC